MDFDLARRDVEHRLVGTLAIARSRVGPDAPAWHPAVHRRHRWTASGVGLTLISALSAALEALVASLAIEWLRSGRT